MESAQEGHVDIVKYLIERGSNVHAETSTQDTALTYASANGHTVISDILLQCGAQLVGIIVHVHVSSLMLFALCCCMCIYIGHHVHVISTQLRRGKAKQSHLEWNSIP